MWNRIRLSALAVTSGVALLAAAASPLTASELDKKTVLSFSAPFEISGQTLPAGTYTFRTLDQTRDVVIVSNADENHVFGSFLTVPVQASQVPTKPEVIFSERPADTPQAVHAWFYPGDTLGWQFLK